MKNRMGIIVLTLVCVALSIALIWNQKQAVSKLESSVTAISSLSNQVVTAKADLDKVQQVNAMLESDRAKEKEAVVALSNHLARTSADLEEARKTAKQQLEQRDAKIAELEAENQALDQRAAELSLSITNLTGQIEDTRRRLAAAEGDKAVLTRELQQMLAEKAELERKFNDISVLRTQVAKLKEEMNVSRRLAWNRRGLIAASEQKGAEQLMQTRQLSGQPNLPARPADNYDLNVEVSADGTLRVIAPPTNGAASTPPR